MVIDNPYRSEDKSWYDSGNQNLTWTSFFLGDTEVMNGNKTSFGTTDSFYKSVNGWIHIGDKFVKHNNAINQCVFLNQDEKLTFKESIIILKILSYWIFELKLKRIYISSNKNSDIEVLLFKLSSLFKFFDKIKNIL